MEQKKRKSCCLVFSLQTGVLMIFTTDILIFTLLCCITGMTIETFDNDLMTLKGSAGFTLMTDGLVILLFLVRLLAGMRYAWAVMFPPKMDYEYIMEFGKLRWHTKRVKNMRIYFKNYALASNVSSTFIFIQTFILFLALWGSHNLYFRYLFLLSLSVFTLVNLMTVNYHLEELDEQVTFRIGKYTEAVKGKQNYNIQKE